MFDFKNNFKDALSNVVALGAAIFAGVQVYLGTIGGGEINWFQLLMAVGTAIVGWLTGKGANGLKKPVV